MGDLWEIAQRYIARLHHTETVADEMLEPEKKPQRQISQAQLTGIVLGFKYLSRLAPLANSVDREYEGQARSCTNMLKNLIPTAGFSDADMEQFHVLTKNRHVAPNDFNPFRTCEEAAQALDETWEQMKAAAQQWRERHEAAQAKAQPSTPDYSWR